jgi:IS30 family transposase
MGKQYWHLNIDERERIAQLKNEGTGLSEIACQLGRDKGTISRELKRNGALLYKSYTPCRAQHRSNERRRAASRRERLRDETIRQYAHEKLFAGWAPEQISGRLPLEHRGLSISTEAIYQYIYDAKTEDREDLIACLRRSQQSAISVTLANAQKQSYAVSFSFDTAGAGEKLEFDLYKGNSTEIYLKTYLRVDVN